MISLSCGGKIIGQYDLIIFDKDGTLIDVNLYWSEMTKLRIKCFMESFGAALGEIEINALSRAMGVDLSTGLITKGGPVGVHGREVVIEKALNYLNSIRINVNPLEMKSIFSLADQVSKECRGSFIRILQGVRIFLEKVYGAAVLSVATNDKTESARFALNRCDIGKFFSLVIGSDCTNNPKPDSRLVIEIARRVSVSPSNTIVIGDSVSDLKMALNAGVAFLGVRTGIFDNLMEYHPNVESLSEVSVKII